jgi:hypothetical protein
MTHPNFGSDLPPGCSQADVSGPDEHVCARCGRSMHESEVDDEASEAFESVCVECAQLAIAEAVEDEVREGAASEAEDKQ